MKQCLIGCVLSRGIITVIRGDSAQSVDLLCQPLRKLLTIAGVSAIRVISKPVVDRGPPGALPTKYDTGFPAMSVVQPPFDHVEPHTTSRVRVFCQFCASHDYELPNCFDFSNASTNASAKLTV